LLKGLECSEIRFSALNDERRFEAEFFRKRFLAEDTALARMPKRQLGDFAAVTDGPHGYHVVDEASPIAMLTAKCAADWFARREEADRIARWVDEESARSRLRNRDIILSTRGTVGMCALIVPEALPANIDQDVARISWDGESDFVPEFVVAYLNSRFGQDHIARYSSGMVQQGMSLSKVREIPIPCIGKKVQQTIADCVRAALSARRETAASLQAAETALITATGLGNWRPPEPLTYTRRASEAFNAKRLDSDYFSPRVTQLLARLGASGRTVRDVAPPRHERFTPATSGDFRYVEISDVRSDGTANCEIVPMREAPSRATWLVHAGDVLTSTVRPIRRLSALVMPEQEGCIASSGFVVLQPHEVPAEVLLTYMRLPVFCGLMDLHTSASLYPAISETDLLRLPFPKLSSAACDAIVESVRSAHTARHRARSLLDRAKRTVEIAIEQDETSAMNFLKQPKP